MYGRRTSLHSVVVIAVVFGLPFSQLAFAQSPGTPTTTPEPPATASRAADSPALPIPVSVSGYIQPQWVSAPGTSNSIDIRRARVLASADLSSDLTFAVQLELARTPALLDAYGNWRPEQYARLTVGQFKVPFSRQSLQGEDQLVMVNRALVVDNLVPGRDNGSQGRDVGAQIAGDTGGEGPLFSCAVGVFNGSGINKTDDNRHKDVATRVTFQPFAAAAFSGDYYQGETGAINTLLKSRNRTGAEVSLSIAKTLVQSEYIWGRDANLKRDGWYALAAYPVAPRWQLAFQYDDWQPNRATRQTVVDHYVGGINFFPSPWVKLQLNEGAVRYTQVTSTSRTVSNYLALQAQFSFALKGKRQ